MTDKQPVNALSFLVLKADFNGEPIDIMLRPFMSIDVREIEVGHTIIVANDLYGPVGYFNYSPEQLDKIGKDLQETAKRMIAIREENKKADNVHPMKKPVGLAEKEVEQ
jgi:hypothetical protein